MNCNRDLSTPSWPGLSRPSTPCFRATKEDVDARHKTEHDGRARLSLTLATAFAVSSLSTPALAHVGHGATASFAAGLAHPLGGLDHVAVMMAVGLWAALKGGRALWLWPATFVGVMLIGGALGMVHIALPFVEPALVASVIALGLLVALAVNLPVAVGAIVVGGFALFHGHAHGSEVTENIGGFEYMAGFALATAALHLTGIFFAQTMTRLQMRSVIRAAGGLCVIAGVVMLSGAV